jgi:hypothetical protein
MSCFSPLNEDMANGRIGGISLVFLGIILWGTICYYDWDIRWTNSAKFQVFKELLGRDGIRIFNGVIIVVAMLALTYFFLH